MRWWRFIAFLLAICACLTIVLMLALFPSEPTQHSMQASFAVLDTAAATGDKLPREVIASLGLSAVPEFTLVELRQARRVLADQPGWLVPAQGGELCLVRLIDLVGGKPLDGAFTPAITHVCVSEHAAQSGQLVEVQSLGTSIAKSGVCRVVGVVPDGVTAVHVGSDHGTARVPVDRNAYEVIVYKPTKLWFIINGANKERRTVLLPSFQPRNASPYSNSTEAGF